MNLIKLGPDLRLNRPPTLQEVVHSREESLLIFPTVEDVAPRPGLAEEIAPRTLEEIKIEARWRQVAFHSEQVMRLHGPHDSDPTRNMSPELAVIHHEQLLLQMGKLGLIETPQPESAPVPVPETPYMVEPIPALA